MDNGETKLTGNFHASRLVRMCRMRQTVIVEEQNQESRWKVWRLPHVDEMSCHFRHYQFQESFSLRQSPFEQRASIANMTKWWQRLTCNKLSMVSS